MGPCQPSSNTLPVIVKSRSHSFKEKLYNTQKKNVKKTCQTGPTTDKSVVCNC